MTIFGIADRLRFQSAKAIREEIARTIPLYKGIETLGTKGDQVQWGGPTLYADGQFATPDGKAHFSPIGNRHRGGRASSRPAARAPAGVEFTVSAHRGKQFNSMVQRTIDPLTGAGRDDVLISSEDLERAGLAEGAVVLLRSTSGSFKGRLRAAPIKSGNLEVHWPEGNSLLSSSTIDPDSMEPDYNALVTIEPL